MRLVIQLRGVYRTTSPQTVGEFKHIPKHDAYLYEGREFSPKAFNEFSQSKDWDRLVDRYGARVSVRVVNFNPMDAARAVSVGGEAEKPKNKGGRPRKNPVKVS